jgi:hypothetical protein
MVLVTMDFVHADLDGLEKIVPPEHAQMSALDTVFAKTTHAHVMQVLVELIAVNYFAPTLVQTKELVTTELVIAKAHSEEQIVQFVLV